MSTRVLLLLALSVFMACEEQRHHTYGGSRSHCMCRRVRERYGPVKAIQDIQIYPPSATCDNMEIVVSLKNGLQYCLDHRVKKVQELVQSLRKTSQSPDTHSTSSADHRVTLKNGVQYCLDPKVTKVQDLV